MQTAIFEKEKNARGKGYVLIIGVDEAGRGPLAGPVVAAAAMLKTSHLACRTGRELRGTSLEKEEKEWKLVRDSKTLSEKQREKAFKFVREKFHVGIGIVHPETIDRMNILEATFLAMKEAVGDLRRMISPLRENVTTCSGRNKPLHFDDEKILLLVDGNMTIPNLSLDQEAVVGGDGIVRSIAAASIVAKVTRDRMMLEYDTEYPIYGFAKHKGYGTKVHMDALRKHGPSPIHRMSFKPVRDSTIESVNRKLSKR